MAEYALAPLEQPDWSLSPDDLAERILQHWPAARVEIETDRSAPMALHALIPFEPPRRELGIAMVWTGDYLSLDPADPDTAAEFAAWVVNQIPTGGPSLHILPKERWDPMPIDRATPEQAIAAHLSAA